MHCCNCWNDFTEYIKSFFVKNEEQIKTEMIILAHQLLPILLPIIKQQIEDIINQRIPGPLKRGLSDWQSANSQIYFIYY